MAIVKVPTTQEVEVTKLVVKAKVRYWEDTDVNGVEDDDGTLIPFRDGDNWCPVIDIDTGSIDNWPVGTTAFIHYKVCDCGIYQLTNSEGKIIKEIDGYVPKIMCPEENGYCDYIIMNVDENGKINKWEINFNGF